jgi:hypothetical protein
VLRLHPLRAPPPRPAHKGQEPEEE